MQGRFVVSLILRDRIGGGVGSSLAFAMSSGRQLYLGSGLHEIEKLSRLIYSLSTGLLEWPGSLDLVPMASMRVECTPCLGVAERRAHSSK